MYHVLSSLDIRVELCFDIREKLLNESFSGYLIIRIFKARRHGLTDQPIINLAYAEP